MQRKKREKREQTPLSALEKLHNWYPIYNREKERRVLSTCFCNLYYQKRGKRLGVSAFSDYICK